jgi:hypothetical protein
MFNKNIPNLSNFVVWYVWCNNFAIGSDNAEKYQIRTERTTDTIRQSTSQLGVINAEKYQIRTEKTQYNNRVHLSLCPMLGPCCTG